MTARRPADVIYGSTPLECRLAGVHPRLHFTEADLAALRPKLKREPWKTFLAEVRDCAGEKSVVHQAFLYALTRERRWLGKAASAVKAFLDKPSNAFSQMYYMALCYDWLYHELQPGLRRRLRDYLETRGRPEYEAMSKHERYQSGVYGWNIASDEYCNFAAAAFALYGDVPKVAPWIRYVTERARLVTQALGPDGVSPEGICYGGFFTETYLRTIDLVQRLMGVDLFAGNAYLRNIAWFYAFSSLPRRRMVHNNSILCLGDGATGHWVGPASYLHKAAAYYRDPLAQWAADLYRSTKASTKYSSLFSLLWYDPAVPARTPRPMPLARHFADKDIVFMRSDWRGDETVLAFKCGPHAGHHALSNYPQCIGGGHMAADAGTILLYARGARMISDGGYAKKVTAYRNTMLVNGRGQTGEYDGSTDWFECTVLRREKRGPAILHTAFAAEMDYIIGNVAPAYGPEAGLTRYLRHLVYLRPDTIVLIDEVAAAKPSIFELWFHADTQPGAKPEHPFRAVASNAWESAGANGRCRITALGPVGVAGQPDTQKIEGVGAHVTRDVDVLRLKNSKPARKAVYITVLDVFGPRGGRVLPKMIHRGSHSILSVQVAKRLWMARLAPWRKTASESILQAVRWRAFHVKAV